MSSGEPREFQARMDSVPLATAFVEAFCSVHGVDPADTLRLTLIVEELLTNTIEHGHGGDCDASVHLQLVDQGLHVELRYADHAPAFDPVRHLAEHKPDLDTAADNRHPGGLGLHLMAEMALSLDYGYVEGRNQLRLVLERKA